jgi:hypothetical protein
MTTKPTADESTHQLQISIINLRDIAQGGFGEIRAIAQLAHAAATGPDSDRLRDDIATALRVMAASAEISGDCIQGEAERALS